MNPPDLLRAYAQFANQHPLGMLTPGGDDLQQAFSRFMGANAECTQADTLSDLLTVFARSFVAIAIAHNGGIATFSMIDGQLDRLHDAIIIELQAQEEVQGSKGNGLN
jgi:hypothetical protein